MFTVVSNILFQEKKNRGNFLQYVLEIACQQLQD